MITVTMFRNRDGYSGFKCEGHADYADSGYDIFCAAVSVLTINAANSIERLAGDAIDAKETDGFLEVHFPEGLSERGTLLMESLKLGLAQICEGDGKPYVRLLFEEE